MALSEEIETRVDVLPDGKLQTLTWTVVKRDGVEIARSEPEAKVFMPGDEVPEEMTRVRAITEAIWTTEVLEAHAEAKAARVADIASRQG